MQSTCRPFALLVALFGLWPACVLALTIPVPQARIKTAGASLGSVWNLFTNGHVGETVRLGGAGTYTVAVRAYGSPAEGGWPNMALLVDGQAQGSVTVGTKEMADYSLQAEIAAGVHTIALAFTNDKIVSPKEDRNLYLATIEIRPPAGVAEPVLVGAEEMAMEGERREQEVLKGTQADIEKNRKGDAVVRVVGPDGKPVPNAEVAVDQTQHDFLFGCNIYMFDRYKKAEENEAYKARFADLFNAATTGFYWRGYEPERGEPHYAATDQVVAWCAERGIRLKGHPLLWEESYGIPAWSKGQPAPDVQKQRVQDIVKRYSGKIEFWEVVNEPAHLRGLKIDDPYRWAREADPKAILIVNDYYVLADGFPPFFKLLQDALRDGVPFDGIGIQAHEPRTMRFPLDQVQRILTHYGTLGKPLYISEYTPTSGGDPITGSHRTGKWDEAAQADYAEKFYRVCFAHPAMAGITWWDLSDQGSWLRGGGMLRADLSPKPVYLALRRLIREEWHTRAEGRSDADGRFAFRGFHGTYRVTAREQGRAAAASLHLARGGPNELVLKLAQ